MKVTMLIFLVVAGLLPACAGTAQDEAPDDPSDASMIWKGFTHTYTAPARWQGSDWRTFGIVAGITAGAFLLDDEVRDLFQRNRGTTADSFEGIGYWYGAPGFTVTASLGTWGVGALFRSPGVRETGMMMVESMLMVGLMQQPLRVIVGRARPKAGLGNTHFRPFTSDNDYASFISGHAWSAVSLSTILAYQIDSTWADVTFGALAVITPLSRIYSDNHWFSDVVMGSALGFYSGRAIWKWHKEGSGATYPITLLPTPGGVAVAGRF